MNASEFNARYPVGTPVYAYPGCRPEDDPNDEQLVTQTRSKAEVLGGHTDVVWVHGHSACIALSHVDVAPRTNTPDVVAHGEDGVSVTRTIKLKRACNGCGQALGDVDNRDVDAHGNLTDVRHECPFCRLVVELERQGWRAWFLTERNIGSVDHEADKLGVYAKGYWQQVDGKLTVVGLRVGTGESRVVARFGDWIAVSPNGSWAVHAAVAS